MTAEQLEASRAERMRQNGLGALTLEDARTWLEETGLCPFLPRRQFATFTAPSFVEAVAGERTSAPAAKTIALAEELLIRLETEGVAVRLNLLGQPGEQPDFIVAAWVLPYVYALRGDRDWRRSPQLTGSRQVSQLAIQAYKLLEAGDATIPQLKHALGREVSESAVLRAITELWQQLRIIPVISAPGKAPQWQLLRLRYQKAIAEGASTSQVTAISVLASIYLQAVIAASMEEVELFLTPLTARSKVREVLRGLVATRQVHTLSLGHAPHFYVAGTLPEFTPPPTVYASSAMPASSSFLRGFERQDDDVRESSASRPAPASASAPARKPAESPAAPKEKTEEARPHFRHQPAHSHARKSASSSAANRGSRHARWTQSASKNGHGNGRGKPHGARAAKRAQALRKTKPSAARNLRNGRPTAGKTAPKSVSRPASASRNGARAARGGRKPAFTAAAKAGNRSRYGFTASSRQRSKKRG
ncbi:MAG: hypothetical protein ABSF23_08805 [Terracidiphilus sp.]